MCRGFSAPVAYLALKGGPKYLAIYELEDHNVLRSAAYVDAVKYQPSSQPRDAVSTSVLPRSCRPAANRLHRPAPSRRPGGSCSPLYLGSHSTLAVTRFDLRQGRPIALTDDDLRLRFRRAQNCAPIDPEDHAARRFLDLTRLTTAIEVPFANNLPPPLRKRRTSLATARLTSPFRLDLKATSFKTFLPRVTCAETRMLAPPPQVLASVWERSRWGNVRALAVTCSGSRVSGARNSRGPKLGRPEEAP